MYTLRSFANGFEYIEVQNSVAHAKIALQGAHIFEYTTEQGALLWLSQTSKFEAGSAIRGGIPICWPRFGNLDKSLPQHGFARIFLFELIKVEELNEDLTQVHLQLKSSSASKKIWNYDFTLDIVFHISETLSISMRTTNESAEEFLLTQAFHTYFQVQNIENITIEGLEGVEFLDTLTGTKKVETQALKIVAETDRVYLSVTKDIYLCEDDREVLIHAENSNSAIVWNPWIEKCSKMSAMQPEAYKEFVCIESANAFDDFKIVKPNESYTMIVEYLTQRN